MTSRDSRQKQSFRNSSSLMQFYHNGKFSYKQTEPYNPEKYRDCASTTERSSSYETLKKKRFKRQTNIKNILDLSPERSEQRGNSSKIIKGEALNTYIGYLQSLVARLKKVQKQEETPVKMMTLNPQKVEVHQVTEMKKRPYTSRQNNQEISPQRSTEKKQILHDLIDESKRKKQIIKLNDIRSNYKRLALFNPTDSQRKLTYQPMLSENVSSIHKKKPQHSSESFISELPSEFRISQERKTPKKQDNNILDLVDLDPKEIKNLTKRNCFKKQIVENWKNKFPEGFFDYF